MYKNQIFCYLWIDQKTQWPYIAIGKGVKIEPLIYFREKERLQKTLMIDPHKDLPIKKIQSIFDMAMKLYS